VSEPLVRVDGVTKQFPPTTGQPFLLRTLLRARRTSAVEAPPALRDVTFELARGEGLGVIGANGAGKSTLLRVIAGTCVPTHGRVTVRGRLSALLSLGVGFHPDITARDCIAVSAMFVGLGRDELARSFDAIVAFADATPFLQTPVRFLSMGQRARLAVSVAVHASPEIMLVDETLSAGDAAFQERCMRRLKALRDDGMVIVMASHAPEAVHRLCDRALWLERGAVRLAGRADDVLEEYAAAASALA
jgi:ABC-type polysaccharide/polyol phosphate transport system ATPase subunit